MGGGKREQRVVMASSGKGIEECFGTNEIPRRRYVTESGPKRERDVERKDAGEMTEAAVKWPSRVEGRIREESVEREDLGNRCERRGWE